MSRISEYQRKRLESGLLGENKSYEQLSASRSHIEKEVSTANILLEDTSHEYGKVYKT